jgi:L-seryl-tRNA(Ser) seleniumtransferase
MSDVNKTLFRYIPSVDEVLNQPKVVSLLSSIPRSLVLEAVREAIAHIRDEITAGNLKELRDGNFRDLLTGQVVDRTVQKAQKVNRPNLRRVLNLTGVVLHTNLGRAVLAESAIQAINNAASGYTNLELDLNTGKRGSRYAPVENLLTCLTGAEAAMVVNNNAAAVLLALGTLANGKEVIVSRGQLVEIGGSFRIPEVMAQSGARLVEVGTTNKTYPTDYRNAITSETALLLHVHTSNYRIVGFTRETSIAELVALGAEFGLPVMSDLGSGSLVDFKTLGLPGEPTVQQVVKAGSDVVTFSGDKLLGGPQAGIIVGKRKYIDRMKKNPLTRAVRIDKFTVAALEATLREYLEPENALGKIPTLSMLTAGREKLNQRTIDLCEKLRRRAGDKARFNTVETLSATGGGALPTAELPSLAVEVLPLDLSVTELAGMLREEEPAVIGRLQDDRLILDLRTLLPGEDDLLADVITRVLERGGVAAH